MAALGLALIVPAVLPLRRLAPLQLQQVVAERRMDLLMLGVAVVAATCIACLVVLALDR